MLDMDTIMFVVNKIEISEEKKAVINKLEAGNKNSGIVNKPVKGIKGRISEARTKNGVRVFHRERRDRKIEILAISSKHDSKKVISILKDVYSKSKCRSLIKLI